MRKWKPMQFAFFRAAREVFIMPTQPKQSLQPDPWLAPLGKAWWAKATAF